MYCLQCNCEFSGWRGKCPVCRTMLVDGKPKVANQISKDMNYVSFVDAIRKIGGSLSIEMAATSIETKRGRRMPYIGRGYAWAKQFVGAYGDFIAKLTTTEVGRDRGWTFPYFGYGFAWEKEIQGEVNGNPIILTAEKVTRERKMKFPYKGYGYAWVQSMSGKCGEKLKADLTITEVNKRDQWIFPYFGFGFAWANGGLLTLTME